MGVVGRVCKKFGRFVCVRNGNRMISSSSSSVESACSRMSPCLVLNPQYKKDDMVYRFSSLKSESVRKWSKRGDGECGEVPGNASKIVGSSHGWLALFNEKNNDLFLSDPLKRRHIKLPSIETLPYPELNLSFGRGRVSKLILSCSPDNEQDCRALITYGVADSLAFCCPGDIDCDWIPLSSLILDPTYYRPRAKVYEDFVYCSGPQHFTCITPSFKIDYEYCAAFQRKFHVPYDNAGMCCSWEDWDLSGKLVASGEMPYYIDVCRMPSWAWEMSWDWPIQTTHLVYAEDLDQLFVVVRFIEGNPLLHDLFAKNPYSINDPLALTMYDLDFPYHTTCFVVLKLDELKFTLTAVDSLDGLAMFVGINHSFAISASKCPELNLTPNSIYFTDVGSRFKGPNYSGKQGGYDVGIFDYQNNIVSPYWNFPTNAKRVRRPPVWFTPTLDLHEPFVAAA